MSDRCLIASIGILPAHWKEETKIIRDLAIGKMERLLVKASATGSVSTSVSEVKVGVDQKVSLTARLCFGVFSPLVQDWSGEVADDVA